MSENKHGFKPKQEFTMGGIAWTIIQTGEDRVKCIASDCVAEGAFDKGGKNNFAVSSLRTYLDCKFLNRLIQAGAPEEMFEYFYIDLTSDDGLKDYGGYRVRIGLITCDEYRLLRGNIPALPGHWWWTATSDSPISPYVRHVDSDGTLNSLHAYSGTSGVRPICVLKSELLASYLGTETVDQSVAEPGAEKIFCNAQMDAKNFFEEARRMCKAHRTCTKCPISCNAGCLFDGVPDSWALKEIEEVVPIIEKWLQEHPRKTRLMDFLEKYPNAKLADGTEFPKIYPINLGYCKADCCASCTHRGNSLPQWCWEQEVQDGETD